MRIYDYHLPAEATPLTNTQGVGSAVNSTGGRVRADQHLDSDHAALSTHGTVLRIASQQRADRIALLAQDVRSDRYSVAPGTLSRAIVGESVASAV